MFPGAMGVWKVIGALVAIGVFCANVGEYIGPATAAADVFA